ncbi:hypothetical protein FGE12_19015 [Aggregicoccus sp. 17bor-14]|uniref:hypothetical protein n=1 Tax=Myxococcaceae TaxID=31 RepID=UPI00129C858E|nr:MULTISPECIES: hypothetical protein [Myxococcaceae]MBF5044498.1 hypothetical protein [Simulacricoccus sp. 17bor-14]MRI90243.1 hypothetical protein [Aggregicoccus sp. 17bor-14]
MTFLKWLVWTACAVGLGVFLASGDVGGHTPLEHMERAWKRNVNPSKLDRVKDGLEDTYESAKDAVTDATDKVQGKPAKPPRERISKDERDAVNRLIAQKK